MGTLVMTRRCHGRMNGNKYLGNIEKMQMHDLDNEKPDCQIDEITQSGNDAPFLSLEDAHIIDH